MPRQMGRFKRNYSNEPLISTNVQSEARNHADNSMLRPKPVAFWIPFRFNAMVLHDILSGDRFDMTTNWVYKHMNDFIPRNLDDYIEGNQSYSNALA